MYPGEAMTLVTPKLGRQDDTEGFQASILAPGGEMLCLKGIKWRATEKDTLCPLLASAQALMCTPLHPSAYATRTHCHHFFLEKFMVIANQEPCRINIILKLLTTRDRNFLSLIKDIYKTLMANTLNDQN